MASTHPSSTSDQHPSTTSAWLVAGGMVAIAFAARMLPHPPNFSPVASIALFGGAYFASKRISILVPLIAMLVSDLVLGFHAAMWATYGCFVASVLMGRWIRQQPSFTRIATACLASSLLFFMMTNLAVWLMWYPTTMTGLMRCYTMAVPFFQNSLAGNCLFTSIMFGSAMLLARREPSLQHLSLAPIR